MIPFANIKVKLHSNYLSFLNSADIRFLEENILLFSHADKNQLLVDLNKFTSSESFSADNLVDLVNGLLIMGKTYCVYSHLRTDDKAKYLREAATYLKLAEKSLNEFPFFGLTDSLKAQKVYASFFVQLVTFYQVEEAFTRLRNQGIHPQSMPQIGLMLRANHDFAVTLEGLYQDKAKRDQLLIDLDLIKRVDQLVIKIMEFQEEVLTDLNLKTKKPDAAELRTSQSTIAPTDRGEHKGSFKKRLLNHFFAEQSKKTTFDNNVVDLSSAPQL